MDTGKILYEYRADRQHPADSLAKVMTLLLAVSACESGKARPNDMVEMTETAYYNIGSTNTTLGIMPGETMTLLDLMYCAFVGNADEACNMVAEHISGSVMAFITEMNALAKELGCINTSFMNTHGQYSQAQYTTARDQFVIYREAMGHQMFVEISGALRYDTKADVDSEPYKLTNLNTLLNLNSKYYYKPCSSGAVSATFEGGYSFVSYAEADGLSLISVILGSDTIVFEDESAEMRNLTEARRLFEWGFSQFSWRTIVSPDKPPVGKAPVTHGAGADFVNLRPETTITMLLDNDIRDEDFIRTITIYSVKNNEVLYAPITAGEVLGEMTLTRNGENYGTVLLVANTNIDLNRLQYIKMQLTDMLGSRIARLIMWALMMLVLGYVALVIRYNVLRRKRLRRIAEAKKRLVDERRGQDRRDD